MLKNPLNYLKFFTSVVGGVATSVITFNEAYCGSWAPVISVFATSVLTLLVPNIKKETTNA